jgi:phosphate transport system substrate-binding protein
MKKKVLLSLAGALVLAASSAQAQIKGAGSSFAANLYVAWSEQVAKAPDWRIEYEPSGSSAGVKAVQDRATDFGASDRPLSRAALDLAGLAQFPTAIGGVVPIVQLPGVPADKLRLDGATLAAIYLGQVRQWNDAALKALNPDLALPALPIVPMYRDEGSGTSYAFTSYLAKQSGAFRSSYGVTSDFSVPGGRGGRTSADVAQLVSRTAGAIGYVDYAYAAEHRLGMVAMKSSWGTFVPPTRASLQAAMRSISWERLLIDQDPTFDMDLTDVGCPGCWPITSATYVLVPLKGRATASVRVLEFFEQALQQGDETAARRGYVPLPARAKNLVSVAMRRWYATLEKSGAGKPQRHAGGRSRPAPRRKQRMKPSRLATALLAQLLFTAAAQADLRYAGSDTVAPVVEAAQVAFLRGHPAFRMQVQALGTSSGLRELCTGRAALVGASRQIKPDEAQTCAAAGIQPQEIPIAIDAVGLVVSAKNTWLKELTLAEVRALFDPASADKLTSWKQLRPAFPDVPLRPAGVGVKHGTFSFFSESVGLKGFIRFDLKDFTDHAGTGRFVAGEPGAIGFMPIGEMHALQGQVRPVALDLGAGPVLPAPDEVTAGHYAKLSRTVYLYVNAALLTKGGAHDLEFAKLLLGDMETFVRFASLIPLRAPQYQENVKRVSLAR